MTDPDPVPKACSVFFLFTLPYFTHVCEGIVTKQGGLCDLLFSDRIRAAFAAATLRLYKAYSVIVFYLGI